MEYLEELYEAQMFKKNDELVNKLQRIGEALGAISMAFTGAELVYHDKAKYQPDFYLYKLEELKKLESAIFDIKEKFIEDFLKYPHLNHPNNETRKDII